MLDDLEKYNIVSQGLENVPYLTDVELAAYIKQKEEEAYNKNASRYPANSVHIAEIHEHREVFKELRVYVTIRPAVDGTEEGGWIEVEGFIQCASLADLAAVSAMVLTGVMVIMDKVTFEVLETVTY